MKIIAITGGIGSGKSVVSSILRILGYKVYDCDSEAKRMMSTDDSIKKFICDKIDRHSIVFEAGRAIIDKKRLAGVIFRHEEKRSLLNNVVHKAVKEDISKCISESQHRCRDGIFFFETAILRTSGLDAIVDEIWFVNAPVDIRLMRLIKRGHSESDALSRIEAQNDDINSFNEQNSKFILNDGLNPVLPRIQNLI